jgi:hypothetical protein
MENQQEREMSVEELAAQKEQMLQFYTESIPYLEAQLKYEDILYKIDETRFKRSNVQMQYAMMMQAQHEAELEVESESELDSQEELPVEGKRKLRKG